MRIVKTLCVLSLVLALGACSCRTRKVGAGEIPLAGEGGPLTNVYFAFDSYALDAKAKETLSSNAKWLKENSKTTVQVEGHADERGTNEYNMALGASRANAAQSYLRSLGVEASRLSSVSYGEDVPVDTRHNEEAWAKNRRVHFNVK